ncbi:MAG: nucleotidyltransferase domain-containing protein [Pseudobdellovibrionaceae bacterium]
MKLIAKKISSEQIQNIIDIKLNWILRNSAPDKIILFGSAAAQEMTDASDIDLVLIYPDNSDLKKISLELAKTRPSEDNWPHDLIFETLDTFTKKVKKGGGACWVANLEGKILFERGKK